MSLNGSDLRRIILVSAIGFSLVLIAAAPAYAAIKIKRIAFNPSGRDMGTNSHLNQEYVYLVNTGIRAKQLRGWKVHDRGRDHVYRFRSLYLAAGDTMHLRTGRGSDGAPACEMGSPCPDNAHYDFYWGLANYVWNNAGDVATLRNRSGNVVDRCRYGSAASSPKRC